MSKVKVLRSVEITEEIVNILTDGKNGLRTTPKTIFTFNKIASLLEELRVESYKIGYKDGKEYNQ